jgi:hypothetical protein
MNQVFLPHYRDCDGMFWCGIDDKVTLTQNVQAQN